MLGYQDPKASACRPKVLAVFETDKVKILEMCADLAIDAKAHEGGY